MRGFFPIVTHKYWTFSQSVRGEHPPFWPVDCFAAGQ